MLNGRMLTQTHIEMDAYQSNGSHLGQSVLLTDDTTLSRLVNQEMETRRNVCRQGRYTAHAARYPARHSHI